MFIAIVAMSLMRCNPMVEKANVSGVVVVIEAEGLHPFDAAEAQCRVLVATPDSTKVRLFLPSPVPKVGAAVPLIVEHYKKGEPRYYLDRLKWTMEGPK